MSAGIAILKRWLRTLVRERANVIWMLVMPIVFSFVFGVLPNTGSSALSVSVVDDDKTAISRAFIQEMKASSDYSVKVIPPADVAAELRNLQADVLITLPKGLARQALSHQVLDIQSETSPNAGQSDSASSIPDLVNHIQEWALMGNVALLKEEKLGKLTNAKAEQVFVNGMKQSKAIQSPILVATSTLSGGKLQQNGLSPKEHSVVGFAVMFIIFTLFGSTGSILDEKKRGTWSRLKTSPASQMSVMSGYGISFVLVGWIQYAVMMLAGRFLFHVNTPFNGWMALTATLYILAIAGLALCVSGLVKTQEQHMTTGSFVATITCMIAGIYWPLDVEPLWMQHISWILPQGWAFNAFETAALSGVTLSVLAWPLTVLAGFAVVFFTIGMVQLRYS